MLIEIDKQSGFCNGVVRAIQKAEQELALNGHLYCLGDIVHNSGEVERLRKSGLETINRQQLSNLKNVKVLLRAHGEPPETYTIAKDNNIAVIDASCRVVLALQEKIKKAHENFPKAQIVIFGKSGHAEVIGLEGQTDYSAIIVENKNDLDKIDFLRQIFLFSQTTMSLEGFNEIVAEIKNRLCENVEFQYFDTICRQVSNRIPEIKIFAEKYDVILFVSGRNSSNGKVLLNVCKSVNHKTYLISSVQDIDFEQIKNAKSVGICGATSTPTWLMLEVSNSISKLVNKSNI